MLLDVDTDTPDEKSIMTYISMLQNALPTIPAHPDELKSKSVTNLINFIFCNK